MNNTNKKPKSGRPEDEEAKLRQRIRDILDGKFVTLLMASVTLWALFGDDIRLLSTDKSADDYFFASYVIMLFLFILLFFIYSPSSFIDLKDWALLKK